MLNSISRRSQASMDNERGLAMVMVIGLGAALTILVTSLIVLAVNNLRQAGLQGRGEQALHAADASVDAVLEELRVSGGTIPEDPMLDGDSSTPEIDPITDEKQEREAVLTAAANLLAASPSRLVTAPSGQWLAIRPEDTDGSDLIGVAYGVGYMPSRANPDRIRIVRAEYEISAFSTQGFLFLSGGDIKFNAAFDIEGAVHTNGNFLNNTSWNADGAVTSSGSTCQSCTSRGGPGSGANKPPVTIDPVVPRDFYRLGISGSERWDLCPDGTVRLPVSENAPCEGTVVSSSGTYRGWTFLGGTAPVGKTWRYDSDINYNGVYYAYRANAHLTGGVGTNVDPLRITLIAETETDPLVEETTLPADHCPHVGGDIQKSGPAHVRAHADGGNVLFVAGRDLSALSSTNMYGPPATASYAHEQIRLQSQVDLDGTLVAESPCNSPGSTVDQTIGIEVGSNADIDFSGSGGAAAPNTAKTTIWTEI